MSYLYVDITKSDCSHYNIKIQHITRHLSLVNYSD